MVKITQDADSPENYGMRDPVEPGTGSGIDRVLTGRRTKYLEFNRSSTRSLGFERKRLGMDRPAYGRRK